MDIESAQLAKFSKGIPTVMNNFKHKKTKIIYIQDEDIRKSINLLDMKKKTMKSYSIYSNLIWLYLHSTRKIFCKLPHSLPPPLSERLYKRDLGQIGNLGGNWHFRWGWFFLGGTSVFIISSLCK